MAWTSCNTPLVADVIRWKEPIWVKGGKRNSKPQKIGEQVVTAEVMALGDYLQLHIRAVDVLSIEITKRPPPKLTVGDNIKRKKTTIARGNCERLLWSDETARAVVAAQ